MQQHQLLIMSFDQTAATQCCVPDVFEKNTHARTLQHRGDSSSSSGDEDNQLFVPTSVRENVSNISKNRKKSCFLDFQKKRLKNVKKRNRFVMQPFN